MKKLIILSLLVVGYPSRAQQQIPIADMKPENWLHDLDFLNSRIQKHFTSFNPDVKELFNSKLEALKGQLDQYSNNEITFKIMQLMAGLGDGHTELQIFGEDVGFKRLPISTYYFDDGLFLTGGHEFLRPHIGSEITHIGGIPTSDLLNRLAKLIAHDNEYELRHSITSYLILPTAMRFMGLTDNDNSASFKLKDGNGRVSMMTIESMKISEYQKGPWVRYRNINNVKPPLYLRPSEESHWYEYLPEHNTMYFYYGTVSNQKGKPRISQVVKSLFAQMDKIKPDKLVIDMRRNTGGNYNNSRSLIREIQNRDWLNQEGKIYAVSGRRTFSAATVTSIWLKTKTNALLIGEPSRGHPNKTDNVEHFKLPYSRLRIEYTTRIRKHWPGLGDADQVPLDISIPVLFSNYAKGYDPVVQYIIQN